MKASIYFLRSICMTLAAVGTFTSVTAHAVGESAFGVVDGVPSEILASGENGGTVNFSSPETQAFTLDILPGDQFLIERLKRSTQTLRPVHIVLAGDTLIVGVIPFTSAELATYCATETQTDADLRECLNGGNAP